MRQPPRRGPAPGLLICPPWSSPFSAAAAAVAATLGVAIPRTFCIPTTSQLLEDREGRHYCAYNSSQGYRAIGAGYALDRDVTDRKRELSGVLADYHKVYEGKECLNDLQINALLALDARRYLNYAYKAAHALDDWCCEVQAVFAELAFAAGDALEEDKDFKEVIEKASSREWEAAAGALKDTAWCEENEKRCKKDAELLEQGCDSFASHR
eukprot:SM000015S01259  [mRNA]  locus=s15:822562:823843:- [translate_table: standard]